jgi:hypothetical protein
MATTYHRTVLTIEVLSEDEPYEGGLEKLSYEITEGSCSGAILDETYEEVTPERMAELLVAQGSDPAFFGLNEDAEE